MVNLWLPWFNYSNHVFFVLFVVKPWLICGYHDLTIVTMFFFGFVCSKTMINLWLPWFNYSNHVFFGLFVVKPWLICGYHDLTIVTMVFWFCL